MITQFRTTRLYDRITRYEAVHQFVKYAMVGVVNVAVHLVLFNLLSFAGVAPIPANAAGFFIASINSFLMNKTWSFRDTNRDAVVRQYFTFLFFTLIGLGLHTAAFALLLIPLDVHGQLGRNLALFGALPTSVLWNFTTYRLWTFRGPKRDLATTSEAASKP